MANHSDMDILDKTVEIFVAAVSGCGDKPSHDLTSPDIAREYLQAVYDKLKEINDSIV